MEEVCYICGKEMKEFDVYDVETKRKVATEMACPNEWREFHERMKQKV